MEENLRSHHPRERWHPKSIISANKKICLSKASDATFLEESSNQFGYVPSATGDSYSMSLSSNSTINSGHPQHS